MSFLIRNSLFVNSSWHIDCQVLVMWIKQLACDPTTSALRYALSFSEQRQRVLAENVANIDTPDYHTRQVDPEQFQTALREALDAPREAGRELHLRGNAQISTDNDGTLHVRPQVEPAANALLHDGTNARLEQLLTDAAGNQLQHEFAVSLLRQRFDTLLMAARGRTR